MSHKCVYCGSTGRANFALTTSIVRIQVNKGSKQRTSWEKTLWLRTINKKTFHGFYMNHFKGLSPSLTESKHRK